MSQTKKRSISLDALQRIQTAEAQKHGGGIPKGSHVGRMQAALAKQQTSISAPEPIAKRVSKPPAVKPANSKPAISQGKQTIGMASQQSTQADVKHLKPVICKAGDGTESKGRSTNRLEPAIDKATGHTNRKKSY